LGSSSRTQNKTEAKVSHTLDPLHTVNPITLGPEPLNQKERRVPRLEILFHYDLRRVGLMTDEDEFTAGRPDIHLGRETPTFHKLDRLHPQAPQHCRLEDPCISRTQAVIGWRPFQECFEVRASPRGRLQVQALKPEPHPHQEGRVTFQRIDLEQPTELPPGSLLMLGNRVLLRLSYRQGGMAPPDYGIIGQSPEVWALRSHIKTIASFRETVLVMGATGTGKELVARALHEASQRQGDLVPVNMSRLDTAMANSELFGHERGAFTGANARREGAFSQAQDGTLFLDEIGDMPLDVQRKLLRTLEAHTFKPLGAQRDRETNARIVAATNRSLTEAIETQEFRADLLERLRALPITVPSLVQRRWDIPLLFVHFLHLQTQQYPQLEWMWPRALHNDAPPVPLRFILRLLSHSWGGNVRQLRNRVTELTAANIGGAPFTDPPNFDDSFLQHSGPQQQLPARKPPPKAHPTKDPQLPSGWSQPPNQDQLVALLEMHNYNQSRAAEAAQVARQTLIQWMRRAKMPRAVDIDADHLQQTLDKHDGDINATARELRVSPRALRLRLRNQA
jgi:DNA-binding NtrC family response regulator